MSPKIAMNCEGCYYPPAWWMDRSAAPGYRFAGSHSLPCGPRVGSARGAAAFAVEMACARCLSDQRRDVAGYYAPPGYRGANAKRGPGPGWDGSESAMDQG